MLKFLYRKIKYFFYVKPRLSRFLLGFLIVLIVAGVNMAIFSGAAAQEGGDSFFNCVSSPVVCAAYVLGNILLWIAGVMGKFLVLVIDILLGVVTYNDFINARAVTEGWAVVRDLCNMFFVVILLVIAFGTILRLETYKYNRLLGKLVIMAILINFSKMIAGFFIDASQVLMLTFVNAFADTAAANFTDAFQIREMLSFPASVSTAGMDWGFISMVGTPLFAIILLIVALMVMIAMVLVFICRIIALWILVVLSPLAYLLSILPGKSQQYSSQWWSSFGKWVTTGPILAFFIWLSLSVLMAGDTNLAPKNAEQQAFEDVSGSQIHVVISEVSSSENVLNFILASAMFMIAMSVAGSLGGMAGSFAGKMEQKIRGVGMKSMRVAASPVIGAYKAARYGAGRGKAYVQRRLGESKRGAFLTPDYWKKGFSKRGETLDQWAKDEAAGKGETTAELMFKGKKGALDREEMARRGTINTVMGDIEKQVGKTGDSRQAMQDYSRRAFYMEGEEGEKYKQGFMQLATRKGNTDDINFMFSDLYEYDEETKNDLRERFKGLGYGETDEDIDEIFENYNGERVRELITGYLGIDKKFYSEDYTLDKKNKFKQEDKNRLMAVSAISESAKDVGHWEQFIGTRDPKSQRYYIMNEPNRREEIIGEARKRGIRELMRAITPHVFRQKTKQPLRDIDEELIEASERQDGKHIERLLLKKDDGSYQTDKDGDKLQKDEHGVVTKAKKYRHDFQPDIYAPKKGTIEHEMFQKLLKPQTKVEMRQMAPRMFDDLVSQYFDENGNIPTEFEAWKKGYKDLQDLKDDLERYVASNPVIVGALWNGKYMGAPTKGPDAERGAVHPWEDGYIPKYDSSDDDKIQDKIKENINYDKVKEATASHGEISEKDKISINEELRKSDYAARFGMEFTSNQDIIRRAGAKGIKIEIDEETNQFSDDTIEAAREAAAALGNEKADDLRKALTKIIGTSVSGDDRDKLIDDLLTIGADISSQRPAVAGIESEKLNALAKEFVDLAHTVATGSDQDKQKAKVDLEKIFDEAGDDLFSETLDEHLSKYADDAQDKTMDTIKDLYKPKVEKAEHDALNKPKVSQAINEMGDPERLLEAIEGLQEGALDMGEFAKIAKDINSDLTAFITSLEEVVKEIKGVDKEVIEQYMGGFKEMQASANRGQLTGFGGDRQAQQALIYEFYKLRKAMEAQRKNVKAPSATEVIKETSASSGSSGGRQARSDTRRTRSSGSSPRAGSAPKQTQDRKLDDDEK